MTRDAVGGPKKPTFGRDPQNEAQLPVHYGETERQRASEMESLTARETRKQGDRDAYTGRWGDRETMRGEQTRRQRDMAIRRTALNVTEVFPNGWQAIYCGTYVSAYACPKLGIQETMARATLSFTNQGF